MPHNAEPETLPLWVQLADVAIFGVGIVHSIVLARRRNGDEPLNWYSRRWHIPIFVLAGLFLVLLGIRTYLVQPFRIPSASMEPSVSPGDHLLVSKFAYDFSLPRHGDVIVFYAPKFRNHFIKRVVGLPGDRIQMKQGVLFINDAPAIRRRISGWMEDCGAARRCPVPQYEESLPDGAAVRVLDRDPDGALDNTAVFIVPAGDYFVLGDNRDNSTDSRTGIGFVKRREIAGRAAYKYFANGHWIWQPIH